MSLQQHPSTSVVGLDWGVVNFVALSNGEVVEQCQPLKKFLPKLGKLQRRMTRKEKFSKNWRKAKAQVTKSHTKVAKIRKDFVHKVSNDTSRKCSECGHTSAENRKTQAKFVCVQCGFSAHADFVGAVNIREAGLASLACSSSSGDVSPSCQEPTEGIHA